MKVTRASPLLRPPRERSGPRRPALEAAPPAARPGPAPPRRGSKGSAAGPPLPSRCGAAARLPAAPPPPAPRPHSLSARPPQAANTAATATAAAAAALAPMAVAAAARRVPAGANQRPRGGRGGRARLRLRIVGKSPAERPRSPLRSPARLGTRLSAPPAQAGRAAASCPVNKGLPPSAASGRRQEAARSREGRDGGGAPRRQRLPPAGPGRCAEGGGGRGRSGAESGPERGPVPFAPGAALLAAEQPRAARPARFPHRDAVFEPHFPPLLIVLAAPLYEAITGRFLAICSHFITRLQSRFCKTWSYVNCGNKTFLIQPRSVKKFYQIFALHQLCTVLPMEQQAAPAPRRH